tara:strand:+ start:1891 stop:3033 length:1143 start_codon:yes stop_codon:yes gene_type:complete
MLISYGKQNIDSADIKNVNSVLKSDFLTQGPIIKQFETLLKKKLKSKYCSVVNNGSSALLTIGKILQWKKGDLIAVPPITFLSSVNTIEHCGAKPIFIDINLNDYCMDPDILEAELKKDKKRKIKAAIVVDYAGQPAQWKKFLKLKKKYNIKLVNDNCHALGSSYKNDTGYAVKYADLVSLSFHPVKAITTGEGGAILTNNSVYDKKAKLIRSHGIIRKKKHWEYKMNLLGYNFRLPDINCALGISQIKKLNIFLNKRSKIAKFYDQIFSKNIKFKLRKKTKDSKNSYHLYPLLLNLKIIKKTKNQIINEFLKNKIKLQVHYIPVNTQPYYKNKYGFNKNKFKNSLNFFEKCISLPIYYDLSQKQLSYIKLVSRKIFKIS